MDRSKTLKATAPRIIKKCINCGKLFEVLASHAHKYKSCGKPECKSKAYSLAKINMSIKSRNRIGKTRREKFARGEIKSRILEFRYSGNGLTESEMLAAPFLSELGFIPHYKIRTGMAPRNGNANAYSVDFAHLEKRLFIEIDGRGHFTLKEQSRDKKRDAFLFRLGWQGFRITNAEIINNIEIARAKILDFINHR